MTTERKEDEPSNNGAALYWAVALTFLTGMLIGWLTPVPNHSAGFAEGVILTVMIVLDIFAIYGAYHKESKPRFKETTKSE